MRSCDVVVVPDFTSRSRSVFEARTLWFLASWIEQSGESQRWPLHVACIGEPPLSVRQLADRCQASVTTHEPLFGHDRKPWNKLRGLEVAGKTDHVLLLDADVFVVSDISGLCQLQCSLAAAPSLKPRVPTQTWVRAYQSLEIDPPTERISSIRGKVATRAVSRWHRADDLQRMFPYYNGGIVLAPWRCGLRSLWEDHLRRLADAFEHDSDRTPAVVKSDQAALATTIQVLRRQGYTFRELPASFHAHYLYLYYRTVAFPRVALLHAFGFGRDRPSEADLPSAVSGYRVRLYRDLFREWRLDQTVGAAARHLLPALVDATRVVTYLRRLYDRHIEPVGSGQSSHIVSSHKA